jgi:hypothetical protein
LNNDSSKLFLYSKLKSDIKLEEYLKSERNFKNRQLLKKFRSSDHNLEIGLGRYKNIPRNQRHCNIWKTLDEEFHFFFAFLLLYDIIIDNIIMYECSNKFFNWYL